MNRWFLTIPLFLTVAACAAGGGTGGGASDGAGAGGSSAGEGVGGEAGAGPGGAAAGEGVGGEAGAGPGGDAGGDAGDVGGDVGDVGGDVGDVGDVGGDVGDVGGDVGDVGGEGEGEGEGEPPADVKEFTFSGVLSDDIKGVATVRVDVFDAHARRSEVVEAAVLAPPVLDGGASCDTVAALDVCARGQICLAPPAADGEGAGEAGAGEGEGEGEGDVGPDPDVGGEDGGEGEGEGEAPAPDRAETCAADVIDFFATADEADGGWSLRGDNDQGALLEGGCGGAAGEDVVYAFTPPAAGEWVVTTQHADTTFDTLLHARSVCDDPESELACNDDFGGLQSRIVLPLGDDLASVFVVVDAWGAAGVGEFVLSAYQLEIGEVGAECDPDGARRRCAEGDFCFVTPADADDPDAVATGLCAESTAPNIANALAYVQGDFLAMQLFGEDTSRDVVGLEMELLAGDQVVVLDEDSGNTLVNANFQNNVYGEAEFVGRIRFTGLEAFPQVDGVRVKLVDSQQLTSNTIDRPLAPLPALAEGEVCDLEGIENGCGEEGVCQGPEPEEGEGEEADDPPAEPPTEGVCFIPAPPVLTSVEAFYDEEFNTYGLRLMAADADDDIRGFGLELLDAEGAVIPLNDQLEPGAFFDLTFPAEPDPPGECLEAELECPAEFEVRELPLDEDNDRWFASGDTTGALPGDEGAGTCGGGAGRHVYAFTPFEDGTYVFTTEGPGADTVLYVRSMCGYSGARAEVGCNDDYAPAEHYLSQVVAELVGEETVWVFVDGFFGGGNGWQGSYELIVNREL